MLTKFKIFLKYHKNLKILKERSRNSKKNYITFIGYMPKLYFGGNIKYFFFDILNSNIKKKYKIIFLNFHKKLSVEFKKNNLPDIFYSNKNKNKIYKILNQSKYVISDYDFSKKDIGEELYNSLFYSKKIQLWHGRCAVSYPMKIDKKNLNPFLKNLQNIRKEHREEIDYFIGDFNLEKTNLKEQYFKPKKFIFYPRPQLRGIKKKHNKNELINVDMISYKKLKSLKKKSIKCIIVALSSNFNYNKNFDLYKLNNFFKKNNLICFLKMHKNTFKLKFNKLSNIKIIIQNSDIYPLLNYFDLLITDTSSLVYDFLKIKKNYIFLRLKDNNEFFDEKIENKLYQRIFKKILFDKKKIATDMDSLFIKIADSINTNKHDNDFLYRMNKKFNYNSLKKINSKKILHNFF